MSYTRRTFGRLAVAALDFLFEPVKSAGLLAALGADLVIWPNDIQRVAEHRGLFVVVLGIVAALDAIAWFWPAPTEPVEFDPYGIYDEHLFDNPEIPLLSADQAAAKLWALGLPAAEIAAIFDIPQHSSTTRMKEITP
ncbi:hypothetical protein [Kitasatospora sp. NPDC002965]|uniref:hypothetical protein n=1 Tax=Kitasatospora sp. NPDC002965 TaxID=3154775 RepID=UPI0033A336A9